MKVAVLTLGCRVNQSESNVIEGTFRENGIRIVDLKGNPDYCIVNTCTVTAKSDYQSRQLIRRAARTGAKVIVTGCYSQLRPKEIEALSGVDRIVDMSEKDRIVRLISEKTSEIQYGMYSRSRPYLKVQDGCNYSCSYCAVPLARGRSRSIPEDEVIRRAKVIESRGYQEIVLTGIHLGSYGHDLPERAKLSHLIRRLIDETALPRIRLSSLEVNEIDDEILEMIRETRVCNHLHIPLQSGSEKILNLMRRHYKTKDFMKKIERISSKTKNIAIGTDVIIGFPEEGEKEFEETVRLVNDLPFSYLHLFPFSPRPDTDAYTMEERTSQREVTKRMKRMKDLDGIKRNQFIKSQVGKTLDIVTEEKIKENSFSGTSSNYLKIAVKVNGHRKGSIVFVRFAGVSEGMLMGDAIKL